MDWNNHMQNSAQLHNAEAATITAPHTSIPVYASFLVFFKAEKALEVLFDCKGKVVNLNSVLISVLTGNILTEIVIAVAACFFCLPEKILPVSFAFVAYFLFALLIMMLEILVFSASKNKKCAVDPLIYTAVANIVTGGSFVCGLPCVGIALVPGAPPIWLSILIVFFSGFTSVYGFINLSRGLYYIASKILYFTKKQTYVFIGIMLLQWCGYMVLFYCIFRLIK